MFEFQTDIYVGIFVRYRNKTGLKSSKPTGSHKLWGPEENLTGLRGH